MAGTIYVIILRILHIGGGIFWAGAGLFMAWFLAPAVRQAGPAGGAVMLRLNRGTRWSLAISLASVLTVLSGILLYVRNGTATAWTYMSSGTGITITLGAITGIISLIIGGALVGPTSAKISDLGEKMAANDGPPSAEDGATMAALQSKMGSASRTQAITLLLSVLLMAVARYMAF
jgi:hypothetical protein